MDKILILDDINCFNCNTEIIAYLLNFIIVYFYTYNITSIAYNLYSYFFNYISINKIQQLFSSKTIYIILINIAFKLFSHKLLIGF